MHPRALTSVAHPSLRFALYVIILGAAAAAGLSDMYSTVSFVAAATAILFLPEMAAAAGRLSCMARSAGERRRPARTGAMPIRAKKIDAQSVIGALHARLIKYSVFAGLEESIKKSEESGATSAGLLRSPSATARNLTVAVAVSIPAAAAVCIAGILTANLVLLAAAGLPAVLLLYPRISNMTHSSDVTALYESEMAYFLAYLQVATMSGLSLYQAMIRLAASRILESIAHDTAILRKWIELDGMSEQDAIRRLALQHAYDPMQKFFLDYADTARSHPVGLTAYVGDLADREFAVIVKKDEDKIGKISATFMMGAMGMIMLPVMMIMLMFVVSSQDAVGGVAMMIFAMPVLFTVYAMVSHKGKPDIALGRPPTVRTAIAAAIAGAASFVALGDILVTAAVAGAAACIVNGMAVSSELGAWRSRIDGFPAWIHDMIERCAADANFLVALRKTVIADEAEMKKKMGGFAEICRGIRYRMARISDRKYDVIYDSSISSKRLRLLLFIAQTVYDGGFGQSVDALVRIKGFAISLNEIKNRMDDTLRTSSLLLYAAPVVLFVAMVGISSLMLSITSKLPDTDTLGGVSLGGLGSPPELSSLFDALKPAILLMSACSGIVVAKTAYYTVRATMPAGVTLCCAAVILAGWDFFFGVIEQMVSEVF